MAMRYSIGEFSKKTGLTIRTLHYYDEIGVLKPSFVTEKGRRFYSEPDLMVLQKIVTMKFLGYSLEQIKDFLKEDKWDLKESLSVQKEIMVEQKKQIENVIKALDHALYVVEHHGNVDASIFMTLINGIQMENEHKKFLKSILDEKKVEQIYSFTDERQREIEKESVGIMTELNQLYGKKPECEEVQLLIDQLVDLMTELVGGDWSFLEEIAETEIEGEEFIFASPFSKEVEEWMLEGVEINLRKRGINYNGKSKG